jgi:hypothetical protein
VNRVHNVVLIWKNCSASSLSGLVSQQLQLLA